jgi:rhodanese-related sulfurtransferase
MKRGAGKIFSAFGITQLIMIAAIGAALYFAYTPWRWENVRQDLLKKYPNLANITGVELEQWLRDVKVGKSPQAPIILDVRSEAEFKVSHIPAARNVRAGSTPEQMNLPGREKRETEAPPAVVVYCTVGYQSSEVAEGLKKAGFTRVQWLEGGIFKWANEQRALEDSNGATATKVHPGNSESAGILNRAVRATIP